MIHNIVNFIPILCYLICLLPFRIRLLFISTDKERIISVNLYFFFFIPLEQISKLFLHNDSLQHIQKLTDT